MSLVNYLKMGVLKFEIPVVRRHSVASYMYLVDAIQVVCRLQVDLGAQTPHHTFRNDLLQTQIESEL